MSKKLLLFICVSVLCLCMSGCAGVYGDDLLAVPKLPGEYLQLQNELDAVLAQGAAYAVATSGTNRQSVQLVDIDGDGVDEAIAFFRMPDTTYRIYVFAQGAEGYTQVGMAEGYGSSLHAIHYPIADSSGQRALAIAWGLEDSTSFGMTVFGVGDEGLYSMLDVQYTEIAIYDLDTDGVDELVYVSRDVLSGNFRAQIYNLEHTYYRLMAQVGLSIESQAVTKIQFGQTHENEPALFIDSLALSGGYVTDVINLSQQQAVNDTIDPASGSGLVTWRALSVFCADIDGDGILDIPVSQVSSALPGEQIQTVPGQVDNRLNWVHIVDAKPVEQVARTYHDPTDGWYLRWPENWGDDVLVRRTVSTHRTTVSFYLAGSEDWQEEYEMTRKLLEVSVFSGDNRAEYVQLYSNVTVLRSNHEKIYGFYLPTHDYDDYALTDEGFRAAFALIDAAQ